MRAAGNGRHTLLFVDDEADVLDLLANTFEEDYVCLTASSGPEALRLLQAHEVSLMITDQRMPGMSGVELIERAHEVRPDLTCILLTAYTDPPDIIDAINRGQVYRYLTKPWDVQDIVLTVEGALEKLELKRENERLLVEAQHRLAALEVLYEVSRRAAALGSYAEVIDTVSELLERVVPLDVSATLVRADPGRPGTLTLRCRRPVSEAALEALKAEVLDAYAGSGGAPLAEPDLLVRVTGRRAGSERIEHLASHLVIPLASAGRHAGVLVVAAEAEGVFGQEERHLLDLLANQAADALAALRTKLDAERTRMQKMVDDMADGLLMTDASGEVAIVNPAARRLLGLDPAEPVTSVLLQQRLGFYPFDLVRGWERSGSRSVTEDLQIGERTLHSVVSPVVEPDGRLAGVVVALRDVTEERRLQSRKEEFVSIVSHELRTPLTTIVGSLDLVLSGFVGPVTEKQRRYLDLAKSATDKLNNIVDDLLDLSSLANGRVKLDLDLHVLEELVDEAVASYGPVFERKGIHVCVRKPASSTRVLVDRDRMQQVLGNLLTNASKFTPEGGLVEIEVFDASAAAGRVGFSVWNNGAPIAEEDLERVFEKFERLESAGKVRGTGLGLPICRSIVEAHGGAVWAESTGGDGARFVVTLPIELEEHAGTPVAPSEEEAEAGTRVRGKRVLVVDDDHGSAWALKGLLLRAGLTVQVSHRADEALSLARRRRPDLILVDLHMPGVDGVRLIEILRHDPDTRRIPIVAVSGVRDGGRALRAGASAFLTKPFDAGRLLQTVAPLLGGRAEGRRVLVVDDDASIRALCVETLRGLGYAVAEACDAKSFLEQLSAFRPELVLMDVGLPDGDGFELLSKLKADRATTFTSVIFISARHDLREKVRALRLGGDDYITKPFEALELGARVESVLRRRESELAASPTTRLPGSSAIEREVERRIARGEAFTLCYLDLDNLKAFNDHYGYAKADGIILQTGDLLREVVGSFGNPDDFIGHVAGDDFVVVTTPARAEKVCREFIAAFDRIIPLYYEREDRERGYIETEDRYGTVRRFPIMSVSAVAVTDTGGTYGSHTEMAGVAAGLKKRAKAIEGSVYLEDAATERASA
ncbi:MAG: response regulator [Deltaproteobacteria bacterium]|nr:MAG: response regulator [Deltaproteobacteria bacterium]